MNDALHDVAPPDESELFMNGAVVSTGTIKILAVTLSATLIVFALSPMLGLAAWLLIIASLTLCALEVVVLLWRLSNGKFYSLLVTAVWVVFVVASLVQLSAAIGTVQHGTEITGTLKHSAN